MAKLFGGKMEDIEGVKYQDLSFKFNVPTRGAGTFTLWGVAGYDSIIDPDMSREEQDKEELFPYKQSGRMWTGATGLGHRIFFSPNTYLKSTLAGTYSRNIIKLGNYEEYVLKPVMDMRDINTNLIFNTYVNAKTSARHTNRTGVTVTGIFYDDNYNVAPGEHHFTGQIENFVDTDGSSVMASVFSQSMFQLTDALQAEVGVNGQYFAWNENFTIEPRVSFRMRVAPKHTIGLATGMHSRRERLDYYFVSNASTGNKMVNKDLDVAKAYHVTTSWDWSITPDLHMKVEPYFQYLYDVPVFPGTSKSVINQTNFWMDEKLVNNGEGRNYGVDLTLERYLKNGFYWMLTGSVFDSQYTGDDDEWHNTRYNRRWLVNVLGGKEWMLGSQKRHLLGVHLRINATGGAWYTPLNMAESLATQDSVEDESKMMSKQWPSIFTVHANIDWQINRPRVSHHVGFNMINVTGTEDRYGFDYNRRHQRMDEAKNAWLLPNLYYRISF
jgi:hypothetical protein